ncbi:MAG: GNAT family N-acetyltransferase [Candidatus Binataceae bacterium]
MLKPPPIRIVEVHDRAAMEQAWALRRMVFIEEEQVPEAIEMDADDAAAFHVLALEGDTAVGCGRMVTHGEQVKIGRMAVLKARRGEGIGRQVLEFLMATARRRGFRKALLHAQLHAEGFYRKNGFRPLGEVFEEAGIPHRAMEREL